MWISDCHSIIPLFHNKTSFCLSLLGGGPHSESMQLLFSTLLSSHSLTGGSWLVVLCGSSCPSDKSNKT